MKRLVMKILPLLLLAAGIAVSVSLIKTAPKAKRNPPPPSIPLVEVIEIQRQDFEVKVNTNGIVAPRTQSTLVSQVTGNIVSINPGFKNGGFFAQGDVLVQIDPADYKTAIIVARSEVARKQLELMEEQARAEQAREEWTTLRKSQTPTALHLRKPQVASAEAALASARARLEQAKLNMQRTRILAPYSGRVLKRNVDIAQFVSTGAQLATIFATDAAEIRLPLIDAQQRYLTLPEDPGKAPANNPVVTIFTSDGMGRHQWTGRLVRTEGEVDRQSRQLFVIAEIRDPFRARGDKPVLRIGQFVQAQIHGEVLSAVFVIPRDVVRKGNEIQVVANDGKLYRRTLDVVWKDDDHIVARAGIEAGDRVSRTIVPFATNGTRVRVVGDAPPDRSPERPKEKMKES